MAGKDSSWLRLEVCRQFSRGKCSRSDSECKFAHPPPSIEFSGGSVTACFDFLRKRCRRENCRFFHPPEQIVTQLVTTGGSFSSGSPSELPTAEVTGAMGRQDKSDRLEVCREYVRKACQRTDDACRYAHPPDHISIDMRDHTVTVCMDFMKGRCSREKCRYFHPLPHLQNRVKQQQVSGSSSSSMLMEQILLNSQRKRPSSTPADVLSSDYRRSAMPYAGPTAATLVAGMAPAPLYTPPAAAQPYDPAAYAAAAAYGAGGQQQQQQQMMSELSCGDQGLFIPPPPPMAFPSPAYATSSPMPAQFYSPVVGPELTVNAAPFVPSAPPVTTAAALPPFPAVDPGAVLDVAEGAVDQHETGEDVDVNADVADSAAADTAEESGAMSADVAAVPLFIPPAQHVPPLFAYSPYAPPPPPFMPPFHGYATAPPYPMPFMPPPLHRPHFMPYGPSFTGTSGGAVNEWHKLPHLMNRMQMDVS